MRKLLGTVAMLALMATGISYLIIATLRDIDDAISGAFRE